MKFRVHLNTEKLLAKGIKKLKYHSRIVDMSQIDKIFSDDRCKIETLDLSWCDLENGGAKALSMILKKATCLQVLKLQGCRLYSQDVIDIMRYSSVTILDLSYNKFGIQGISAIVDNNSLLEVNLECSCITAEGASLLSRSPSIRSLNLDWNNIDSRGLVFLARNPKITNLLLRGNPIGNSGPRFIIRNNSSLICCKIDSTKVGIIIAKRLKAKIKANRRAHYLSSLTNGDFSLLGKKKYNRVQISRIEAEMIIREFVYKSHSLNGNVSREYVQANVPLQIYSLVDKKNLEQIIQSRGTVRLLGADEVDSNASYPVARVVQRAI